MNMTDGTFVVGVLLGYDEEEWKSKTTGNTGVNRRLGIVTGERETGFGQTTQNVQIVDIMEEVAPLIKARAEELKGKRVMIRTVFRARKGGRDGAWLSAFMPKDADIIPIATAKAAASA